MGFYLSPSVNVLEQDLSLIAPAVATSIAGYVTRAKKGPVWNRTLITNENDLVEIFGAPDSDTYEHFFSMAGYLDQGNTLYVVRAVDSATAQNGCFLATSAAVVTSGATYIADYTHYVPTFGSEVFQIFSKYPGAFYDYNEAITIINYTDWSAGTGQTSAYLNTVSYGPSSSDEYLILVKEKQSDGTYSLVENYIVSTSAGKLDANGDNMFVETRVNPASERIVIFYNTNSNGIAASCYEQTTSGGADGTYLDGDLVTGYDMFLNPEDVDVNILFDGANCSSIDAQKEIISICESRMDCFGLINVPKAAVVNVSDAATQYSNCLTFRNTTLSSDTNYAALYNNWHLIADKYNSVDRWVPYTGFVAGAFAYNDQVGEAWFAPAGDRRGRIKRTKQIAFSADRGYRDLLFKNGINPIVKFPGEDAEIFGDKTLQMKPSAFDQIGVRRLFIVMEKSIATAARYFIFEQNDDYTRRELKNTCTPFLADIKARRGIEDFIVITDATVNTPARVSRNELWCAIWVKPIYSSRYVVLQFNAVKPGVSFEELLAQAA